MAKTPASGGLSVLATVIARAQAASDLFRGYVRLIPRLGLLAASVLFLAEASERKPISRIVGPLAPKLLTIKPPGYRFRLIVRRGDTDKAVVRQVLGFEEYGPVAHLPNVKLIVDCGANVGVTSYYLLHRYPNARLIALEPDAGNYMLCRRNLEAFGSRAVVIRGALWPECRPLRISPSSRARGSWALSVEPAEAHDGEVEGLTLSELLKRAGVEPPIDLLKIDIEGAETEVFRAGGECLTLARHLVIELHSPAARTTFAAALAPFDYTREESGESTIVRDLRPRVSRDSRGTGAAEPA
jgi:FkbM family methyltransferase